MARFKPNAGVNPESLDTKRTVDTTMDTKKDAYVKVEGGINQHYSGKSPAPASTMDNLSKQNRSKVTKVAPPKKSKVTDKVKGETLAAAMDNIYNDDSDTLDISAVSVQVISGRRTNEDGRLASEAKTTAERDNIEGLIDRASVADESGARCCLRCCKEVAQFPDLICWTDPSKQRCRACCKKKKPCVKVSIQGSGPELV